MLTALFAAAFALQAGAPAQAQPDYKTEIEKWRADYTQDLLKPQGWLSVAGLTWLKQGANTLGSAEGSAVLLPKRVSPPQLGTLTLDGSKVMLSVEPGSALLLNDQPAPREAVLAADVTGKPDRLKLGDFTFNVIQRADRIGIRMYDPQCEERLAYKGLHWFPADPKWIVKALFVAYDPPKPGMITNVLGQKTPVNFPGYLVFKVNGVECRLDAQDEEGGFFLNFQDKTSGKLTYPAGRFLDVPKPLDKIVLIDFNKATNPPCAYTGYATCPLPPEGNRLNVEIKAGEKRYH